MASRISAALLNAPTSKKVTKRINDAKKKVVRRKFFIEMELKACTQFFNILLIIIVIVLHHTVFLKINFKGKFLQQQEQKQQQAIKSKRTAKSKVFFKATKKEARRENSRMR